MSEQIDLDQYYEGCSGAIACRRAVDDINAGRAIIGLEPFPLDECELTAGAVCLGASARIVNETSVPLPGEPS